MLLVGPALDKLLIILTFVYIFKNDEHKNIENLLLVFVCYYMGNIIPVICWRLQCCIINTYKWNAFGCILNSLIIIGMTFTNNLRYWSIYYILSGWLRQEVPTILTIYNNNNKYVINFYVTFQEMLSSFIEVFASCIVIYMLHDKSIQQQVIISVCVCCVLLSVYFLYYNPEKKMSNTPSEKITTTITDIKQPIDNPRGTIRDNIITEMNILFIFTFVRSFIYTSLFTYSIAIILNFSDSISTLFPLCAILFCICNIICIYISYRYYSHILAVWARNINIVSSVLCGILSAFFYFGIEHRSFHHLLLQGFYLITFSLIHVLPLLQMNELISSTLPYLDINKTIITVDKVVYQDQYLIMTNLGRMLGAPVSLYLFQYLSIAPYLLFAVLLVFERYYYVDIHEKTVSIIDELNTEITADIVLDNFDDYDDSKSTIDNGVVADIQHEVSNDDELNEYINEDELLQDNNNINNIIIKRIPTIKNK